MQSDLVTKTYVDKRFEQIDKRFEQVDRRFEQIDKKLNTIMVTLDSIVGKLETLQQENTIGAYQTRNLETIVEDHTNRITKLEQTFSPSK